MSGRLTRWSARGLGLLLLGAACGESLVDTEFEGQAVYTHPKLRVREYAAYAELKDDVHAPRFAMFWNPDGIHGDPQETVEQPRTSREVPDAIDSWSLFETPGEDVLAETEAGGRYGIGRLRVYDDRNDNKKRDRDEPFIGDSQAGLLYVPEALDEQRSPFGRPLPAGTYRVEFPVDCGLGTIGDDDCGVALGKECQNNDDCGDGVCMREHGRRIWAHGVCGYPYDPEEPCLPKGGAPFFTRKSQQDEPGEEDEEDRADVYYLQACGPGIEKRCREDMNEYCDLGIGACFTGAALSLDLGGDGPETLCKDPVLPEAD